MSEAMNPCDTGTPADSCKGCPDCGPASTKRTPDAIAARLGKVSDGPWTAWDRGIGYEVHGPDGEPINMGHRETFTKGDAEFIATAPETVSYLLTFARKQAAALERVEGLHKRLPLAGGTSWCTRCNSSWPCPTRAALGDGDE